MYWMVMGSINYITDKPERIHIFHCLKNSESRINKESGEI